MGCRASSFTHPTAWVYRSAGQWMRICVAVVDCHFIVVTSWDSYIETHPAVFIEAVLAWRKIAEPFPGVRASL